MPHNQSKKERIEVWVPKGVKGRLRAIAESATPPQTLSELLRNLIVTTAGVGEK